MKFMRVLKNNKGFSLVELMVVVAIIGILASIAIPNFQRFSAKAKTSEAKSNLSSIYGAMASFNAEWQVYNPSFLVVGWRPAGYINYRLINATTFTTLPVNYAGPAYAAADVTTATYCSANAIGSDGNCGENSVGGTGAAAPVTGASAISSSTFTTTASAILLGGLTADTWTIDNTKTILNPNSALP